MAANSSEKKTRWLKVHLYPVLAILLLLLALIYFGWVRFALVNSKTVQEQVVTLIEKRRIIPEKHLIFLDDKTRPMADAYNQITEELSDYYTDYATRCADAFGDPEKSLFIEHAFFKYGGVVKRPYYYYFVDRVSSAALYPDASQRLNRNPLIGVFIDGGGSGGLWATHIHSDFMTGEEIAARVQEYFAVIDMLTFRLAVAHESGVSSSETLYGRAPSNEPLTYDIGKTLSELKNEYPEGEFVVRLDGFPDSAAACFGEQGAEYVYFFFGGHDGDFEKAMNECEDQLKCAGFITTANILFPDMEDDMSFEDFFSLIDVDDYEYFGEDTITAEGWLRFAFNGMEVMVNTNEVTADGGWNFTGAEIVKRNALVSIVDPEILNTNQDLAEAIMFGQFDTSIPSH